MHRSTHHDRDSLIVCAILSMLVTACGSSDHPDTSTFSWDDVQPVAGSGGSNQGTSGSKAPPKPPEQHWRGIQSCSGYSGEKSIATTSDETTIASYSKNQTRVSIKGVNVGPSPEFSCAKALNLEGVVTSNNPETRFTSDTTQNCTSTRGTPLVVGNLDGNDLDLRSDGLGDWELEFSVTLENPEDPDAGVPDFSTDIHISCKFELKLM